MLVLNFIFHSMIQLRPNAPQEEERVTSSCIQKQPTEMNPRIICSLPVASTIYLLLSLLEDHNVLSVSFLSQEKFVAESNWKSV